MNETAVIEVTNALLAASLPIDLDSLERVSRGIIDYYANTSYVSRLQANEVAVRITELWKLWIESNDKPSDELSQVVQHALTMVPGMEELASNYFDLVEKLQSDHYLSREYAVAFAGSAPLVLNLVTNYHLGLDRIRRIINVPKTTVNTVEDLLSKMGVSIPSTNDHLLDEYEADQKNAAEFFGDIKSDDADDTLRNLLGHFARAEHLASDLVELTHIRFDPYLFMLYYECVTLEFVDRIPGTAVYENSPRNRNIDKLYEAMFRNGQGNPILNNAKSVYAYDESWASTKKLTSNTKNGGYYLAGIFEVMSELPYTSRLRVARIIRAYIVLVSNERQKSTMLSPITPKGISNYVLKVAASNSKTSGVLDQRLVDFLTQCIYDKEHWIPFGLGSSVNESNASGKKYGDVEYLYLDDMRTLHAYEAHGGSLRDEYVHSHIKSLSATVLYHQRTAKEQGSDYRRCVTVYYVAHNIDRLSYYYDGYHEIVNGVEFTFKFITFENLLELSGGIENVSKQIDYYTYLIHRRISDLSDCNVLKQSYIDIIDGKLHAQRGL